MKLPLKISLLLSILLFGGCGVFETNFSLSPDASWAKNINELKSIWYFCEKCLGDNKTCKPSDVDNCKNITLPSRDEALSKAVGRANVEAIYFLIDVAKTDVNGVTRSDKATPLHVAAYYNSVTDYKIANYLISKGADVNATKEGQYRTPLLTAIWKKNIPTAKLLLEHGADPNIEAGNGVNACYYAISDKLMELIPLMPGCCSMILGGRYSSELKSICQNNSQAKPSGEIELKK